MQTNFSKYQKLLIVLLCLLQFTVTVDFIVLSPLSALLLPELNISTGQFGLLVSAYAWSAGISGFLSAGLADKFDRKKLLVFFYTGFVVGTFLCGIATDYYFFLFARIATGIFGGVIGSVNFAVIADSFPLQVRGKVMGFMQMSFAGATVLGLPAGLYAANKFDWHAPFLLIVAIGVCMLISVLLYMRPVNAHLQAGTDVSAITHLRKAAVNKNYLPAFFTTLCISLGGFMLMPFGSAFAVNNLGLDIHLLPYLYLICGTAAILISPITGRLADKFSKELLFAIWSVIMCIGIIIYCHLPVSSFSLITFLSTIVFVGFASRLVCSGALFTAVPKISDRGAFMSINSSVNMTAGGLASLIAGTLVSQSPNGRIYGYDVLSYVVAAAALLSIPMLNRIGKQIRREIAPTQAAVPDSYSQL